MWATGKVKAALVLMQMGDFFFVVGFSFIATVGEIASDDGVAETMRYCGVPRLFRQKQSVYEVVAFDKRQFFNHKSKKDIYRCMLRISHNFINRC